MAKIKKGTYRFNDVIVGSPPWNSNENQFPFNQPINFTVRLVVSEYGIDSLITCDSIESGDHFIDGVEVYYNAISIVPSIDGYDDIINQCVYRDEWLVPAQYITIPYDQDVSDEFGVWFTANTKEQRQISGKWTFKDVLDIPSGGVYQEVNFTLTTKVPALGGIDVFCSCDRLNFVISDEGDPYYEVVSSIPDLSSYGFSCPFTIWSYSTNYGWSADTYGEGIKTVDFGDTPQWVSVDYFDWHINNTVRSGIRNLAIMGQLIDKANAVTGKADADLTSGVNSLIEGFGGGGAIDLANIEEVDSIENPTSTSPTIVKYNGEMYLLVEDN